VFANSIAEPEQDRGELNKREKGGGEFFIAGGDTTVAFDRREEVFDAVSTAIKSGAEGP
jgi:hypothetical protein